MCLTVDVRLIRNSRSMGVKIVGSAFAASGISLVQHGRASKYYFGERHSWPSHLQANLVAAYRRDTNPACQPSPNSFSSCGLTNLNFKCHA